MTDALRNAQMEEILSHTFLSTGFNVAVNLLFAAFLYSTLGAAWIFLGVVLMLAIQVGRVMVYRQLAELKQSRKSGPAETDESWGKWTSYYWYLTLATATIWSGMALASIVLGSLTEITFALVVMAGISAGAANSLYPVIRFFAPYIIILLTPSTLVLLFDFDQSRMLLALCTLLFGAFLLSLTWGNCKRFQQALAAQAEQSSRLSLLEEKAAQLDRYARQMTKISNTDDLTGLANRRHLQTVLARAFDASRQQMKPLSLIICDIDHFKELNDSHGHPAGDSYLKQVARILQEEINQETDLVARLGGDEFVLLLPNRSAGGAIELTQRLESRISSAHTDPESPSIRMSFGIAFTLGMPSDSARQLMKRADNALYLAKKDPAKCWAVANNGDNNHASTSRSLH